MKCKYTETYYDGLDRKTFKCENKTIEGKDYCIFHDPEYFKSNPDEVRDRFKEKVGEKIKNNEDLIFIGYNLPDFNFSEIAVNEINVKVFFDHCKFQNANFSGVVFKKDVSFSGAIFNRNSDFGKATFKGKAIFMGANFNTAHFVRAKFNEADFSRIDAYRANFNNAEFEFANFEGANIKEDLSFLDVKARVVKFTKPRDGRSPLIGKGSFKLEFDRNKEGIVIFNEVIFSDPRNVVIYNFDPSKFSFLGSIIEGIQLHLSYSDKKLKLLDLEILERLERCKNRKNNKNGNKIKNRLIEFLKCGKKQQINLDREIENILLEIFDCDKVNTQEFKNKLIYEYKSLRKSLESNKYYAEASELFIEEMKILRDSLSIPEKIVSYFYELFSCFGESILRPFLLMFIVIFIIPALLSLNFDNKLFLKLFVNVTANFFQIPRDLGGLEIPIRLTGAVTLGLLFIAFRRRFERK